MIFRPLKKRSLSRTVPSRETKCFGLRSIPGSMSGITYGIEVTDEVRFW